MKLRLLSTPLSTAALLLILLGCSKKDAPAVTTPAVGTGSYTVDGVTRACQVTAALHANYGSGQTLTVDYVDVQLVTTPEPASGREILKLTYDRPNATATYQLRTMYFFTKNSLSLSGEFTSSAATITPNSDGSYSGTFAGQGTGNGGAPAPYTALTAGNFTNARK